MKKPGLKTLRNKLDRIFSEYIRRRDKGVCCTCGKKQHWKDTDAGHYISRTKLGTKYDETNVHAQCQNCNRFKKPMAEYAQFMYDIYGDCQIRELLQQSQRTLVEFVELFDNTYLLEDVNTPHKAYHFLIKHYTKKLRELRDED